MKSIHTFLFIVMLAFTIGAIGCGKKEEAKETSATTAQSSAVDPATAATVTGKISFEGKAPERTPVKMNADAVCAQQHTTPVMAENVIVNANNTLKNVFIYVKKGLEGKKFDVPVEAVSITQEGCMYRPHVFGMMATQPLKIINADPTLHNIHAMPTINSQFNIGQPVKGMETEKTFDKPEVMVHFKCDVHPWMSAYVGVLEHPYYSVSGDDGTFSLKNLPPGTYTIEAWHEQLGTQTQEVTVAAKESKELTFTFKSAAM